MRRCVLFFIATVALTSGASLKPAAKQIVNAANDLVTVPNVRKSILYSSCNNDDVAAIVRSLEPITPKCLDCLFENTRKLADQVREKQITESQVPQLLTVACKDHLKELLQLQNASAKIITPGASVVTNAYNGLTDNVKGTLQLIQKLGEDVKNDSTLVEDKTAYCARVKTITDSVRNYNEADRASIVNAYPPSEAYVSSTGSKNADFNAYLDMVDKRCGTELNDEEKEQLEKMTFEYNLEFRDNIVPALKNLTQQIQNLTVDQSCLQDSVLVKVATKLANAICKDYNARIKSNQVKQALNKFIVKSNELKKAAENSA